MALIVFVHKPSFLIHMICCQSKISYSQLLLSYSACSNNIYTADLNRLSHSRNSCQIRKCSILKSKFNISKFNMSGNPNIFPIRPGGHEIRAIQAPPIEEILQDAPFVGTFSFDDFDNAFMPPTPEINFAAEVQPVFYNNTDIQVVATLSVDENGQMTTNWLETEVCSFLFSFFFFLFLEFLQCTIFLRIVSSLRLKEL